MNKGAVAVLTGPDYCTPRFRTYDAAPRPAAPCFYDYENCVDSDEELPFLQQAQAVRLPARALVLFSLSPPQARSARCYWGEGARPRARAPLADSHPLPPASPPSPAAPRRTRRRRRRGEAPRAPAPPSRVRGTRRRTSGPTRADAPAPPRSPDLARCSARLPLIYISDSPSKKPEEYPSQTRCPVAAAARGCRAPDARRRRRCRQVKAPPPARAAPSGAASAAPQRPRHARRVRRLLGVSRRLPTRPPQAGRGVLLGNRLLQRPAHRLQAGARAAEAGCVGAAGDVADRAAGRRRHR